MVFGQIGFIVFLWCSDRTWCLLNGHFSSGKTRDLFSFFIGWIEANLFDEFRLPVWKSLNFSRVTTIFVLCVCVSVFADCRVAEDKSHRCLVCSLHIVGQSTHVFLPNKSGCLTTPSHVSDSSCMFWTPLIDRACYIHTTSEKKICLGEEGSVWNFIYLCGTKIYVEINRSVSDLTDLCWLNETDICGTCHIISNRPRYHAHSGVRGALPSEGGWPISSQRQNSSSTTTFLLRTVDHRSRKSHKAFCEVANSADRWIFPVDS